MFDIIIIGTGPAGITAAREAAAKKLSIAIIDSGQTPTYPPPPNKPFHELRRHENQEFFNMPVDYNTTANKAAAQLTPNRLHMLNYVEQELPIINNQNTAPLLNTHPFQTLAQGGLSAGWGAACFTYDDAMLQKIGLPDMAEKCLQQSYAHIAQHIGISGPNNSTLCQIAEKQPALKQDSNAHSILKKYEGNKSNHGLTLEESSLAALSQPLHTRSANPYHDIDFWSDHGHSVYRSTWDLNDLKENPYVTIFTPKLALTFKEQDNHTILHLKDLKTQQTEIIKGRAILLAAGPFGTYRLCANSLGIFEKPNPYLCNPYLYMPAINLAMLGKKGSDQRHSLSQLFGTYKDITLQFYSYRSLMLQRLIDQTPTHPWLARQFWRLIVESLTIIGCHYPDHGHDKQTIHATPAANNNTHLPALSLAPLQARTYQQTALIKNMLHLGLIPMGLVQTQAGASIHYGGTIPFITKDQDKNKWPIMQDQQYRPTGCNNIYIVDNSGWNHLPSRGPTFTIMAASHTITRNIINQRFTS